MRITDDFDWDQGTVALDYQSYFRPKIVLYGNMGSLLGSNFDADGDADDISGEERWIHYWFQTINNSNSTSFTKGDDQKFVGDDLVGAIGNWNIVTRANGTQTLNSGRTTGSASSDVKFKSTRIVGGDYDGYVRINSTYLDQVRVFGKWDYEATTIKIIIVTSPDYNWETNQTFYGGNMNLAIGL